MISAIFFSNAGGWKCYYYIWKHEDYTSQRSYVSPPTTLIIPAKPTLSLKRPIRPTDGDSVILTCTASTPGVNNYQFKKGSDAPDPSATADYTISAAAIGSDDGTYSCITYIHTVTSIESATYNMKCESSSC